MSSWIAGEEKLEVIGGESDPRGEDEEQRNLKNETRRKFDDCIRALMLVYRAEPFHIGPSLVEINFVARCVFSGSYKGELRDTTPYPRDDEVSMCLPSDTLHHLQFVEGW